MTARPPLSWHVEGGVGHVCLERPEKRNAINHRLVDGIADAIAAFVEGGVAVAVLRAAPPVFCSGADLAQVTTVEDDATERLLTHLLDDPVFWVAALEGPAYGAGVSIAGACPVTICAEDVVFSLPELRFGSFPTGVLSYIEPIVGRRRALALGLTGEPMTAAAAVEAGLVTEVVPIGEVEARVAWWVAHLTSHPTILEPARRAWQGGFRRPEVLARKQELDVLLDPAMLQAARAMATAPKE